MFKVPGQLLLLTIALLGSSCADHIYSPALKHKDIAYLPKPASFDSLKVENYVSAGFNTNVDPSFNDMLISGQINLSRGHVFNKFNLAYGIYGVGGEIIKNFSDTEPSLNNGYFFGAIGGRLSANLFKNSGRTDFRYLGTEISYSHEFGAYANFRKNRAKNLRDTVNDPADSHTDLLTIGLTSEIIFHNLDNTHIEHGIRFFLGGTLDNIIYNKERSDYFGSNPYPGFLNIFNVIFPKLTYYLKVKNYFGSVETGNQILVRFGYKF